MAVAVLSMGSCQEYDFSFTEQDVFKGAYERNFTNTFGNIDSDETWDFSEYGDLTRASISYNSVCQYAQGNGETHGVKWYEVEQGTLNWIVDNLPEFTNNTANTTGGNSFSFFMKKGQSIEILPIYVGYATMSWELHMVAAKADNGQDRDIVVYRKNDAYQQGLSYVQKKYPCDNCKATGKVSFLGSKDYCTTNHHDGHNCSGYGLLGCPENGKYWDAPWITCPHCVGRGFDPHKTPCTLCDDAGMLKSNSYERCPQCNGTKRRNCVVCYGFGGGLAVNDHGEQQNLQNCTACDGKGYIDYWHDVKRVDDHYNNHTLDAFSVRSTSVILNGNDIPDGTEVYFYLKITDRNNLPGATRDIQSSKQGQMKLITPTRPTNIPADYDCMILGVEDLNKSNDAGGSDGGYSDWDFNDIVFLVTGKLPEVVRETKTLTSTIKKRYMIEDLGSTFDQDFNDMVVDVEQTTTVVMKLEDGEIKSQSSTVEQKATVKHLGGTLPIQIKVGDYTFGRVTNPMDLTLTQQQLQGQQSDNHATNSGVKKNVGIDPEISATITGWNPATNNIVCYVWKIEDVENTDPNTSDIWRVEFPVSGVVPFIIAVDPSTPWTEEHELAPINDWRAGNPADYSPVN